MRRTIGQSIIELVIGDITQQDTEAIVNAANSRLAGGGGVDGAIHGAGGPEIMAECRKLRGCPTGQARITGAGELKARYVIHAVGPIWRGGHKGEAELLASCHRRSLELASKRGIVSIAFPAISTGAYGYPMGEAANVAVGTVADYLREHPGIALVRFVLFNEAAHNAFAKALAGLLPEPESGAS